MNFKKYLLSKLNESIPHRNIRGNVPDFFKKTWDPEPERVDVPDDGEKWGPMQTPIDPDEKDEPSDDHITPCPDGGCEPAYPPPYPPPVPPHGPVNPNGQNDPWEGGGPYWVCDENGCRWVYKLPSRGGQGKSHPDEVPEVPGWLQPLDTHEGEDYTDEDGVEWIWDANCCGEGCGCHVERYRTDEDGQRFEYICNDSGNCAWQPMYEVPPGSGNWEPMSDPWDLFEPTHLVFINGYPFWYDPLTGEWYPLVWDPETNTWSPDTSESLQQWYDANCPGPPICGAIENVLDNEEDPSNGEWQCNDDSCWYRFYGWYNGEWVYITVDAWSGTMYVWNHPPGEWWKLAKHLGVHIRPRAHSRPASHNDS